MPPTDWNERYATGDKPWDSGEPDPHLIELVESGELPPGRVLEIGCGTGTNAFWLAERGFTVLATDLSPVAIELAEAKRAELGAKVELATLDFLADDVAPGSFDLVFDRAVWHVFDDAADRARFAERVEAALKVGGRWLTLAGSTEGPERDHGPPRRTARDLVLAVEPHLDVRLLRTSWFSSDLPSPARSWVMLAEKRAEPAQPSSLRD